MNMIKANNEGFTLIETLVYLALLGLIMVFLLASMIAIIDGSSRGRAKDLLQAEGDFLLAKINWAIAGDWGVVQPVAVGAPAPGGGTGNALAVSKGSSTLTVDLNGSDLRWQGEPLNNDNLAVIPMPPATAIFSHEGGGANPESVTARFRLVAKTAMGQTYSQDFSITKYLRK